MHGPDMPVENLIELPVVDFLPTGYPIFPSTFMKNVVLGVAGMATLQVVIGLGSIKSWHP